MKIGVVDVGGGYRGIFQSGVLDYCLDHDIHFDLGIGVSAGCVNLAAHIAHQRGWARDMYTTYGLRSEYAGLSNIPRRGCYMDLDYIFKTLCRRGGLLPLDYQALMNSPSSLMTIAVHAETGLGRYFTKEDVDPDTYDVFGASCALPIVCPPQYVNGVRYFDGAFANPAPFDEAFARGCDRVVLLLSRKLDYRHKLTRDAIPSRLIEKQYPNAAKQLSMRAARYNAAVDQALKYEKQGKMLVIAPQDTCGVDTMTRSKATLMQLYETGYHAGERILNYLRRL